MEGTRVIPPHSESIGPALEETTQIAQVTFHQEKLCFHLCNTSGSIYADEEFADLFSSIDRPTEISNGLLCCTLIPNSDNISRGIKSTLHMKGRAMSRYLERYLQGEYQGIYDEILVLGEAPLEPAIRVDVLAVMNEIMRRVRYNLEHVLIPNLHAIGYRFGDGMLDNPDNLSDTQRSALLAKYPLFLPPDPKAPQLLQTLEQIVERPIPLSLTCWYRHIGAVNLIGAFPPALMREGTQALPHHYKRGYTLDPLCIEQVEQVLKEVQFEFTPAEYEYGWILPLSWDGELKYGYSGSGSYGLTLTSNVVDVVFQGGKYTAPFVNYLRFCLKQGGFPGLGKYISIHEETLRFLTKDLLPF